MIEIIPNFHPIFVHFTVALLTIAIGFFLLAKLLGNRPLHEECLTVARWNLWLGTGFALITVVTGFFAYNSVAHDTPSHAAMTLHRNWALFTIIILLAFTFWGWWQFHTKKTMQTLFLVFALFLLGLLFSTAWHGGELVYRYGLGVMSLPDAEDHTSGHVHSSEMKSSDSQSHEHAMTNDQTPKEQKHGHEGHSH
jgi:uncharacterized membrane protein